MDESWHRRSNDTTSSYGQTFKRSKMVLNTGDDLVHFNSSPLDASTGPKSCFEPGKIGAALETPLLEQYRSALSDLNGRAFPKEKGVSGGFARRKENQEPHFQPVSSFRVRSQKSFPAEPSRQHYNHLAGSCAEASNCQDGDLKLLSAHPPVSPVSLDWQDSQVKLSQSETRCLGEPNAGPAYKGGCTNSETSDEEEDDADLFYDWRAAAGAATQEDSASEKAHAESGAATDRPSKQGFEATQCSRNGAIWEVGVTVQSLGGQCWSQNESLPSCQDAKQDPEEQKAQADSDLENDSQEGALSQLLEMVDEDVLKPGSDIEADCVGPNTEPEFMRISDVNSARCELPLLMENTSTSGQKGRVLSREERSRFILEASQAVLTDSGDQSGGEESEGEDDEALECPVCGVSLKQMEAASRDAHTNRCLDGAEGEDDHHADSAKAASPPDPSATDVNRCGLDNAPLVAWLDRLQLGRYAEAFVKEEVDFDALHCLKEEDLESMGVVTLGPKRKLLAAIETLRRRSEGESTPAGSAHQDAAADAPPVHKPAAAANRQITDFFPAPSGGVSATAASSKGLITNFFTTPDGKRLPPPSPAVAPAAGRGRGAFVPKKGNPPGKRGGAWKQISGDPHEWHLVPGTDFRVDGFRFQSPHCRYWFLSHFHADHYQGLTRNFRHGVIFCTPITARLVHMKLGVPLEKLRPLPLNERTRVDNCHVTLLEANHCPGAAMMLFEPDGAKPTLHTGDFRYCPAMARYPALRAVEIGTLILDTTYCDPQYDFPEQDAVIQFVIDAIQAETFNPKTLFLIGAYTIGKERVFLEVARELNTKVYVGAARRKVLACLDLPAEDMARLTTNENESNVHVVPLWSLANFKRLTTIAKHYQGRYNTFVSFSPTGWSFGRGKKRTTGTRRQQGTIVRYEVPYSEHSSFSELRAFVRVVRPGYILPHVNNDGGPKAEAMLRELLKEREPDAQ
ncbi:putative Sterile alpha motifdomain-containing protein [Klebsormidium nitens]|uniref:Putative Sterile alpha motifdomain-containing protein n=1 Tax=Klebsormidium nitens TaxID=105231 RepID=A0A1Y1HTG7_KLENI|nr:putative Sterile alpha motifdomain-containing protein [Klebsormidium nitens]|eukprot:GAQ80301.1 putative Sterile alpha motifdomain-containing protein [Klebsormidium nitens]